MSQLLSRMQSQLAATSDPTLRAELMARIACNLTRIGEVCKARHYIANVRSVYSDGRSGRVTVWLMFAEALIHYFEDRSSVAIDRIKASLALSVAMGYSEFTAVAAGWKAHIEFHQSRFSEMLESMKLGLMHATEDNLDAQSRFAIVYSNAFYTGGDDVNGQHWFLKAHSYAVRNGDQAGIEAVQYNKAAFSIAHMRLQNCLVKANSIDLARLGRENDSTQNLNALIQTGAFPYQLRFLNFRLAIVAGNFEMAIGIIEEIRRRPPSVGYSFDPSYLELEWCYCNFMLQRNSSVEEYLRENPSRQFPNADLDDQAVAFWMLLQLAADDNRFGDALQHRAQMESIARSYTESLATLMKSLSDTIKR